MVNKMFIANDTLDKLIVSLQTTYEICCNLVEEKGDVLVVKKAHCVDGIPNTQRGSCQHTIYTKYILHTHPEQHRAYPSAEDIIKVIKHKHISFSFIATTWGIWLLECKINKKPTDLVEENNWKQSIKKRIDLYDRIIPNKTKKNDVSFTPAKYRQLQDISKDIENKFHKFGLRIDFTSWEQIENQGYYSFS